MNYLISSNSYHIVDNEISKIMKNKSYEIIDFLETNIEDIIEEANYISLFNDEKNIVIKNALMFVPKSSYDTKLLEEYLENPNPLTTLVFVCNEKVDAAKKITKIITKNNKAIIIKPLTAKEIVKELMIMAKNNKYTLTNSDALIIASSSLNNYDIAYNMLEKIMLYYSKPTTIKHEDLINLISISMEDNNFKFVDAVIHNDIKSAINILNDFKQKKIEPILLINLLAREYRLMLIVKKMTSNKENREVIIAKLSLKDWQLDKLLRNAYTYTISDLEEKLLELTDMDYQIKKGSIDKYLALEMFILKD